MRVSREEAAKNREKVVKLAGEQFREKGYEGIGIVSLMKAAGLTHGGFYKQFKDKESLILESTKEALKEDWKCWTEGLASNKDDPIAGLKAAYLGADKVDDRQTACVFSSLASEAPRHPKGLRRIYSKAVDYAVESLTPYLPKKNDASDREEAMRLFAQMLGGLILARAVDDPELRDEILNACQK